MQLNKIVHAWNHARGKDVCNEIKNPTAFYSRKRAAGTERQELCTWLSERSKQMGVSSLA